MKPKISICIPTYNRINLLLSAIDSILNQTCKDFELIICDNASTDSTPLIMSEFNDDNISYIRHPEIIGKIDNIRSGFAVAKGEYFIKLNDDDRLIPEFLARTSAILDKSSNIDFVTTDQWIIDPNNCHNEIATKFHSQRWGRTQLSAGMIEDLLEIVFVKESLPIGATLFRRSALQEVGFIRPNIENYEENDLFIRLAIAGKKCYYLPELLMEYRSYSEVEEVDFTIPYLIEKLNYLTSYEFDTEKLEMVRLKRIAETNLLLGLRLIEVGENPKGRQMIVAGKSASPSKMWKGLCLSLLPMGWREKAFNLLKVYS